MSKIKKEVQYNFKATKEEIALMKIKAKSANISVSALIRSSVNSSIISFNDEAQIDKLTASINWVGNNLNQVAHVLNIANLNNFLRDTDFDEMKDILKKISIDIEEIKNDS